MFVYLVRHADAEPKAPGMSDEERKLTELGREITLKVTRALKKLDLKVDYVISSPLVRAVETAQIIKDELRIGGEILKFSELIPGANFDSLLNVFLSFKDGNVLAVGHEPLLGDFLGWILCSSVRFEFKKNAIACVRIESFRPCGAVLEWFLPPDVVLKFQDEK